MILCGWSGYERESALAEFISSTTRWIFTAAPVFKKGSAWDYPLLALFPP